MAANPSPHLTLPPFSAQTPQPVASTSAAPPQYKTRRRLPPEANAILTEHVKKHGAYPNIETKRQLLSDVHSIKGCEWYTLGNVDRFLQNKRKSMREKAALCSTENQETHKRRGRPKKKSETVDSILWPSLDQECLLKLATLYESDPNPTTAKVAIWGEVLKVDAGHIDIWIRYKQAERESKPTVRNEESDNEDESLPHLPTPEATASPEPTHRALPSPTLSGRTSSESPISPFFPPLFYRQGRVASENATPLRQATTSQRVPSTQSERQSLLPPLPYAASLPVSSPALQASYDKPSPGREGPPQRATSAALLLQHFALTCKDALCAPEPEPEGSTRLTPQEFARRFEPHEHRIQEFLDKTQKGAYASLGLVPAMIPPNVTEVKHEHNTPMHED